MLFADDSQTFTKIQGFLEVLETVTEQSFDVICCHNAEDWLKKMIQIKLTVSDLATYSVQNK